MPRQLLLLLLAAGCASRAATGPTVVLRPVTAEVGSGEAAAAVAANEERVQDDPTAALAAADDVRGPLDRSSYAQLWAQRGVAHALLAFAAGDDAKQDPTIAEAKLKEQAEQDTAARAAFDMLLALDPTHRLAYGESPHATFMFQESIADAATRPLPAIDVDWKRDVAVGDPVPIDVEVVADPKSFLARAVLFVRRRGEESWRQADVELAPAGGYRRIVLPGDLARSARGATALELYLRAYDAGGNEVLDWASPERPREVPLRWDPPPPWWRKWWVWAITGSVIAAGTGIGVYAASWQPSDNVGGDVVVGR